MICRKCKKDKSVEDFYSLDSKYKQTRCKKCILGQYWASLNAKGHKGILSHLLKGARNRGRWAGKEYDLTIDELMEIWDNQNGCCAISGRQLEWIYGDGPRDNNVSIDRIDINRGYTKDNVQLVCKIVNVGRNTQTIEKFIQLCKEIAEFNG